MQIVGGISLLKDHLGGLVVARDEKGDQLMPFRLIEGLEQEMLFDFLEGEAAGGSHRSIRGKGSGLIVSLAGGPGHGAPAQDMDMQVIDRLSPFRSVIDHEAIAILQSRLGSYSSSGEQQLTQ